MPKSTKKQSSSLGPILLVAAGVVILLGLLLWQIISANSSQAASASTTVENIRRVSPLDAKKALDNPGTALFLDVRDADSFATQHIPGAINIPLGELKPGQWIIPYCT
jgi:cytoskeletal protein RodZ